MQLNYKILISLAIAILILIIFGVSLIFFNPVNEPQNTDQTTQQVPIVEPKITSASDISNSAIDNDLAIISGKIDDLGASFTRLDKSFSDINSVDASDVNASMSATTIIDSANAAINPKIDELNALIDEINATNGLSDNGKEILVRDAQKQSDAMTALKTEINTATGRPDAIVIYRKVALSLQTNALLISRIISVITATDIVDTTNTISTINSKLDSRISKISGPNYTTLRQLYLSLKEKTSSIDSTSRSTTASVLFTSQINTSILSNAYNELSSIKGSLADLKNSLVTLVKYVKELN